MRNLERFPCWRPDHLGKPLPESEHAASVAIPQWADVIAYEEKDPALLAKLQSGYPRFRIHGAVTARVARYRHNLPAPNWFCLPFPSLKTAHRCARFVARQTGIEAHLMETEDGLFPVAVPPEAGEAVFLYWRHCGEIVSSRQLLDEGRAGVKGRAAWAEKALQMRLGRLAGTSPDSVYLFPTGMAAVAQAFRVATGVAPGKPTAQFGFPYVDTLRIQQKMGGGVHFFPDGGDRELSDLESLVSRGEVAAVFCECPANPLLRIPDLERLADRCRTARVPLIVDNTLDSFDNLDVMPFADMVVTSLTKSFSGAGDVMGGSLILNRSSALYADLHARIEEDYENLLWPGDALALEKNARDYEARMIPVNRHARVLVDMLRADDRVARVYYPDTEPGFRKISKPGSSGHGGLFSMVLEDAARATPLFYDAVRLNKGPSLGTRFTLLAPYTMLAHYHELAWAEKRGISPYLLRISTGREHDLNLRFEEALEHCRAGGSGRTPVFPKNREPVFPAAAIDLHQTRTGGL